MSKPCEHANTLCKWRPFEQDLVTEILRHFAKTDNGSKPLKFSSEASLLSAELLRLFIRGMALISKYTLVNVFFIYHIYAVLWIRALFLLLATEAVARASSEAEAREEDEVTPVHVEAIMAQLLLDF